MVWNSAVDQTMRLKPIRDGSIRQGTDAISALIVLDVLSGRAQTYSDRIASQLGSPGLCGGQFAMHRLTVLLGPPH